MLTTLPLLAAAALLLALLVRQIRIYNSLKAFGGHWSAGWSRLWLLKTGSSGELHKRFTAINTKYGSTARIGPQMLITCNPELIRTMNAVRSNFTRGIWYSALKLHPDLDNITSLIDERAHADVRARMAPGYSGKENSCIEQAIFRTADLARITSFFTLDVISKVAFGQTFGFLENDEDPYGYQANLMQMLPAIIMFGVYTELTKLLKISFIKAAMPKSTDKRGLGRVMGFAKQRVSERFGTKPVERQDMLGSFIRRGLSQEQLESETLTQITAGSDSTASALRVALHFICTSPRVLGRLLREAEGAIASGRMSRPVIKDAEARSLPYLQACIKESLRISPPVTGLLAKEVPKEGYEIDVDGAKKFAPPGTQIAWNSWGVMYDKTIFDVDADVFRPERWLAKDGSDEERAALVHMTETVGLCFGYGRFGCLGRGVATMELNKAVVEILLRYNLQPCSLAKPFTQLVVGFTIHQNMNFVITSRDQSGRANVDESPYGETIALPGAPDE